MEDCMNKILEEVITIGIEVGIKLVVSILIIFVGYKLIKAVVGLVEKSKGFSKLNKSVQTFCVSATRVALKALLFITILTYIGVPMTSVLAILGSLGLALGLALQGGLSNIAGGILILIFKPFKVGDHIDNHIDSGIVESINIFYTVLVTKDNRKISLPNGPLSNASVINYSTMNKKKLELKYFVDNKEDISKIKKIIKEVVEKENIIKNEEIVVRLGEYTNVGSTFYIYVWVRPEDSLKITFNINEKLKEAFDKNNINKK
jgi:small conductance mechanosensitive channel